MAPEESQGITKVNKIHTLETIIAFPSSITITYIIAEIFQTDSAVPGAMQQVWQKHAHTGSTIGCSLY